MQRTDQIWKNPDLVRRFLEGVREAVPYGADQLAIMLRVLAAAGSPPQKVLDLGCGSGVLARAIAAQYPDADITLLDFSEPMLDAARTEWAQSTPPPHLIAADLAGGDWVKAVRGDAPFDAVVSGFAIHHLSDTRKHDLFGEIFDLLAAGGMFVNLDHVASPTPWVEHLSDELIIDALHAFHGRSASPQTREQVAHDFINRLDKSANILAPVEMQCEWLRRCGFVDVDCYFKVFELAVFGGRKPDPRGAA